MRFTVAIAALAATFLVAVAAGWAQGANVLYNPSFAHGLRGWRTGVVARGSQPGYPHILVRAAPSEPLLKCDRAQRGHRFIELNVPAGAAAFVEQSIIVPVHPSRLRFRAWGQLEPVKVTVSLLSGPFTRRLLSFSPPLLQASPTSCSGAMPIGESLSVARFAGQAVGLRIRASSQGLQGTIGLSGATADLADFSLEAN